MDIPVEANGVSNRSGSEPQVASNSDGPHTAILHNCLNNVYSEPGFEKSYEADQIDSDSSSRSNDASASAPMSEHSTLGLAFLEPSCGWCFEPQCTVCQPAFEDSTSMTTSPDIHANAFLPKDDGVAMAKTILQAMSTSSDRESSMILAAIRSGISQPRIHKALLSRDYDEKGLAAVLEAAAVSQDTSPTEIASDTLDARTAWDLLLYETRSSAQHNSEELSGTVKPAKRRNKAKPGPPTLVRTASQTTPLRLPFWSLLPMQMTTNSSDPFDEIMKQIQLELTEDIDIETYCGSHAHLSIMLRPDATKGVPRLSQLVGNLVRSFLPDEKTPSVTSLAIMWLHWCLWSWMLYPTAETFNRLPKLMRPTPWQICSPHALVYDFIIVPDLRDYVCRKPMKSNQWITEAARTVLCSWPKTSLHALCRNAKTGAIDLHVDCKTYASKPKSWSFGPSVRAHLPDIDQYMRIRPSDTT